MSTPNAPFSVFSDTVAGTMADGTNNGTKFTPSIDRGSVSIAPYAGVIVVWNKGDSTSELAVLKWEISSDRGTTWHPLVSLGTRTEEVSPVEIILDHTGTDNFAFPMVIGPASAAGSFSPIFGDTWRPVLQWDTSVPGTTAAFDVWWCPSG